MSNSHSFRSGSSHVGGVDPSGRRRAVWVAVAVMVTSLVALSCTDDGRPPLLSGLGEQSIGVRTDLSCDELVGVTRTQLEAELAFTESQMAAARSGVTEDAGEDMMIEESDSVEPDAAEMPVDAMGAPTGDGKVVAGTNNQETGVDEADIVKTDGKRIVSLVDGVLRVVRLDATPAVDGSLDLRAFGADGGEMFLRGDEALLLLPSWGDRVYMEDDMVLPDRDMMTSQDAGPRAATAAPEPAQSEPTTTSSAARSNTSTSTTGPSTTSPSTTEPSTTTTSTSSSTTTTSTSTTITPSTTTTLPEVPAPAPLPFDQGVRILRIDISGDAGPEILEQRAVEGELVAARMIDRTARVVVRSVMPVSTELQEQGAGGLDAVESTIEELGSTDVLPRVAAPDGEGTESLGDCGDVAVLPVVETDAFDPGMSRVAAQPSNVSVLTVGDDLVDLAPTTVAGLADVVYASTDSLFVTSGGWDASGPQTLVHRFDLGDEGPASYTGSGAVPGTPLNQYSLSERDGDLRIVTTTEGEQAISGPVEPGVPVEPDAPVQPDLPVAPGEPDPNSPTDDLIQPVPPVFTTEGRLTVLRPDASGALQTVGAIDDLGVGERVQSVRFLGDMAYVVTFRQTDPLYAVDLSDPTDPVALGELKITGFSQYLHPVGDGLLLGVGREATEDGMDVGFKASLFDVSDPSDPVEVDKVVIPDASSLVSSDPLAFTWDPGARQAIIPLEQYRSDSLRPAGPAHVALVLGVTGDELTEVAQLSHASGGVDPWQAQILRSLVVDRDLWTLSPVGLGRSDADDPSGVDLLGF